MIRRRPARLPGTAAALLGLVSACVFVPADSARANSLVADLSRHLVAITTGFVGTDVLLFGATDDAGDVVVIVPGPDRSVVVHRKSRVLGVWALMPKEAEQEAGRAESVPKTPPNTAQ